MGIQVPGGLVQQENPRIADDRPRNRNPLDLPA